MHRSNCQSQLRRDPCQRQSADGRNRYPEAVFSKKVTPPDGSVSGTVRGIMCFQTDLALYGAGRHALNNELAQAEVHHHDRQDGQENKHVNLAHIKL